MNTLARNDLHSAYGALLHLRDEPITSNHEAVSILIDTSIWLCHVCQALSEDLDSKANPGDRLAELQLRIYKLEKALKSHTNTQDAHNL